MLYKNTININNEIKIIKVLFDKLNLELNEFKNLFENLDGRYSQNSGYDESTKPTSNISNIYGYWTLSFFADNSFSAWGVDYGGNVSSIYVGSDDGYGVRAVITLKI